MKNTELINQFSAKGFGALNKNLKNADEIKKMLINYKWSVKHLQAIDEAYAQTAVDQFNKMVKQFGVVVVKPKAEKKTEAKKA